MLQGSIAPVVSTTNLSRVVSGPASGDTGSFGRAKGRSWTGGVTPWVALESGFDPASSCAAVQETPDGTRDRGTGPDPWAPPHETKANTNNVVTRAKQRLLRYSKLS